MPGGIILPEQATPSTPATGYSVIYPKADGLWYFKDDAGVEHVFATDAIASTIFDAKGDLITASAAGTPARLPVGANGKFLKALSTEVTGLVWGDADVSVPLFASDFTGLTLSNNAVDAVNDIDIAIGACADSTLTVNLSIASALTKRLDATWVTGTNQGGRSSSLTLTDTTWHVFIMRVAGVDDIGFDTSATGANLITDHSATALRRIGSIIRNAGSILKFWQNGDDFELDTNVNDFSGTLPTARTLLTCTVPNGIRVRAKGVTFINSNGANNVSMWIWDTQKTDVASNTLHSILAHGDAVTGWGSASFWQAWTNTSKQVAYRASHATTGGNIATSGWKDPRGKY